MTDNAVAYCRSLRETIGELVTAISNGEDYEGQPADEYLMDWPLELVARVGSPFEILLTFGGPDARIVWDGRYGTESARLIVNWWQQRDETTSDAIRYVARFFEDIMADMAVTS
jgi:hypothetical protein